MKNRFGQILGFSLLVLSTGSLAGEIDVAAARKLAKQNNCFRCHAVEHVKNGPAWVTIGTKYYGKPDAEAKLIKHLTSGPKVRLREDDVEEEHKVIKFRDEQELVNLARWILSL